MNKNFHGFLFLSFSLLSFLQVAGNLCDVALLLSYGCFNFCTFFLPFSLPFLPFFTPSSRCKTLDRLWVLFDNEVGTTENKTATLLFNLRVNLLSDRWTASSVPLVLVESSLRCCKWLVVHVNMNWICLVISCFPLNDLSCGILSTNHMKDLIIK